MEKRTCNHCGIEKTLDDMATYKDKVTGESKPRNVCKACHNQQTRESKQRNKRNPGTHIEKPKDTKPIPKEAKKPIHLFTDNKEVENVEYFTQQEIKVLKAFIKDGGIKANNVIRDSIHSHNDTQDYSEYDFDKSNRVRSAFNMDLEIKKELFQYCRDRLLNASDFVNIAVMQYLKKYKSDAQ